MATISHREMRNKSAEILRRVAAGEELVVTNHGRPVARLSPIHASVVDELIASGAARPPVDDRSFRALPPAAKTSATSADIVADVRGYERGY